MEDKFFFKLKNFLIIEAFLLVARIFVPYIPSSRWAQNFFGDCTPPCPTGILCPQVVTFCSTVYGDIFLKILWFIFFGYLIIYLIYVIVNKFKKGSK